MDRELNYQDYATKLEGEYREAFEKINIYIKATLSSRHEIVGAMNEVTDLLLSAQADSRPVESVIGKDIEKFSKGIAKSNREPFMGIVFRMISMVLICVIIAVVQSGLLIYGLVNKSIDPWMQYVDISGFITGFLVAMILSSILDYISRVLVFRIKKLNTKTYRFIFIMVEVLFFLLSVTIFGIGLFSFSIPRIFLIVICIIYAVVLSVFGRKYSKKHHLKEDEEAKPDKIKFKDDVRNKLIDMLRMRYQKVAAKLEKQGKPTLSPKEWFEKDSRVYQLSTLSAIAVLVLILFGFIVQVAMTSTIMDTCIFSLILIVVEIPIIWLLYNGVKSRFNLVDEIRQKNTDIFDESLK